MMVNYTEREVIEDGVIYIVREYESGSVAKWQKQSEEPEPEPQVMPTTQDIMDKLNDMSGDQVSVATLDSAYREGVNSYV